MIARCTALYHPQPCALHPVLPSSSGRLADVVDCNPPAGTGNVTSGVWWFVDYSGNIQAEIAVTVEPPAGPVEENQMATGRIEEGTDDA